MSGQLCDKMAEKSQLKAEKVCFVQAEACGPGQRAPWAGAVEKQKRGLEDAESRACHLTGRQWGDRDAGGAPVTSSGSQQIRNPPGVLSMRSEPHPYRPECSYVTCNLKLCLYFVFVIKLSG